MATDCVTNKIEDAKWLSVLITRVLFLLMMRTHAMMKSKYLLGCHQNKGAGNVKGWNKFVFTTSSCARDRNMVRENEKYPFSDPHHFTMMSSCENEKALVYFNIV